MKVLKGKHAVLVIFYLLLMLILPGLAQAGELNISDMRLDVWPEYDDSRVMVQYMGEFSDKKAVPAKVKFYVPKESEDIHACAISDDGAHQCNAFERDEKDGLIELSYDLSKPKFAVMFYLGELKSQGANKKFNFAYRTSYPTDKLTIDLQQPLKATNFKSNPSSNNTTKDEKGFKYLLYDYDNVKPGKEMALDVQYTKSDPNPSVKKEGQTAGGTSSQDSSKQGTNPWIILAVVGALIILPLGGYFLATSRTPAPAGRVAPKMSSGKGKGGKSGKFCANCGTRADFTDKFCPNCGHKMKR